MNPATMNIPASSMREARVPEIPEALRVAADVLRESSEGALHDFRAVAWDSFEKLGIPETKHEDFSFVSSADLKAILTRVPEQGQGRDPLQAPLPSGTGAFSLTGAPESLATAWTKAARAESDAPAALAAAFAPDPAIVRIGASLPSPLRLRFTGNATRTDYAVFLRVEPGVEASVAIECDNADAESHVNAAVFVSLGKNSKLDVTQRDASQGFQTLKLRFAVERDARLNLLSVSTGSRLARLAIEADLLEPGAEIDLRGAVAVAGANRSHRYLRIRHAAPDCVSRQLFKAVVPGAGRSSVDGTVTVERGAQRTDARQLLQHLMLSPEGRADAKPRLLIHADDVKCSHGATVGKTDPAQLFYLRSRGLDPATANALLTQAFLGEALAIAPEDVRSAARAVLTAALTRRGNP